MTKAKDEMRLNCCSRHFRTLLEVPSVVRNRPMRALTRYQRATTGPLERPPLCCAAFERHDVRCTSQPIRYLHPCLPCPLHTKQTPPNSPQHYISAVHPCSAGKGRPVQAGTARRSQYSPQSGIVQMTLHRTRRTRSRKSAKHRRDGSFTTLIRTFGARLCPA